MRTPGEVARDIEDAREEVRSAWMDYSERDAAERSAVEGVIAAYRDEVLAGTEAGEAARDEENGVRVTLHVTERSALTMEVGVPEEFLADMRQDGVDTRDVQAVSTWLAGNLDTDDQLIVEGLGDVAQFAVTERALEGVSPATSKG